MTDTESVWMMPMVGALLLLVLDLSIQKAYRAYAAKGESVSKEMLDECVLRKMSRLIRFFSSPDVQFDCPREMRIGEKFTACLSIQFEDKFVREFEYDGDSKLSVKPKIYASLSGDGFQVKINSDADRSIDSRNLVWTWTIVPLRNGIRALSVHLTFSMEGSTGVKTHSMWVDERSITVSENKLSAIRLWCSAKWKSAMAIGLEITLFYFLIKYVLELG